MRTVKRFCALLLALMLICATVLTAAADDTTITLYGFSFTIRQGKATIYGYDSRSDTVVIPNKLLGADVVEIADYAFYGLDTITSLSFEDAASLTGIGTSAFSGCSGVTSLTLPATVTELGFGAFQNCTGLQTLVIGEGITALPTQCFNGCTALTDVTLPDTVTTIGERAFAGCASLTRVTVPAAVQQISDTAFSGSEKVVICAVENSEAIGFADDNAIPYMLIDAEPITYFRGDADGDETVTILDATKIQRVLADLTDDFDGTIALRGCVTDDEGHELSILDATAIQRYLADFTDSHRIGESETGIPIIRKKTNA